MAKGEGRRVQRCRSTLTGVRPCQRNTPCSCCAMPFRESSQVAGICRFCGALSCGASCGPGGPGQANATVASPERARARKSVRPFPARGPVCHQPLGIRFQTAGGPRARVDEGSRQTVAYHDDVAARASAPVHLFLPPRGQGNRSTSCTLKPVASALRVCQRQAFRRLSPLVSRVVVVAAVRALPDERV